MLNGFCRKPNNAWQRRRRGSINGRAVEGVGGVAVLRCGVSQQLLVQDERESERPEAKAKVLAVLRIPILTLKYCRSYICHAAAVREFAVTKVPLFVSAEAHASASNVWHIWWPTDVRTCKSVFYIFIVQKSNHVCCIIN